MRVSIIIPTLNGGPLFKRCLRACVSQQLPGDLEILVIDSSSTDGTAEFAESIPGVRVHSIDRSTFRHGSTRNLAASLSSGDVIAFLTQDAVPASPDWLLRLVQPIADCHRIGLAFGKQIPHPRCRITVKRDVRSLFRSLADDDATRIVAPIPGVIGSPLSRFFSNVNSAIRRQTWEECPFPDVTYAEDLALAEAALLAGWWKAYVPTAAVLHSHDLPLRAYYRRMLDEFTGIRHASSLSVDDRLPKLVAAAVLGTCRDVLAAVADDDYDWLDKARWIGSAPAYNVARRVALRRSARQ